MSFSLVQYVLNGNKSWFFLYCVNPPSSPQWLSVSHTFKGFLALLSLSIIMFASRGHPGSYILTISSSNTICQAWLTPSPLPPTVLVRGNHSVLERSDYGYEEGLDWFLKSSRVSRGSKSLNKYVYFSVSALQNVL